MFRNKINHFVQIILREKTVIRPNFFAENLTRASYLENGINSVEHVLEDAS